MIYLSKYTWFSNRLRTLSPRAWLLVLLSALEGFLAFHVPRLPIDGQLVLKLSALWILAGVLRFLGLPMLSRFSLGMVFTALLSPFFHAQQLRIGPVTLFHAGILFLALALCVLWLEEGGRVSDRTRRSALLILLFLGIPCLMFFQLAPLLQEVFSKPWIASFREFLPIPMGFLAFLLGFILNADRAAFVLLGIPLIGAALAGFFA